MNRIAVGRLAAWAVAALAAAPGTGVAGTDAYQWWFMKNHSNQTDCRLILHTGCNTVAGYRAGSGTSYPGGTNECQKQIVGSGGTTVQHGGWLPNGTYRIPAWNTGGNWLDWPGRTVRGPVIRLPDKTCYNGTPRTELFVHSSYPWSSSRYYSEGCIKVSNTGGPNPASGEILDAVGRHFFTGQPNVMIVSD